MHGSSLLIFWQRIVRPLIRLSLASAGLGILLLGAGACNSTAPVQVIQVEVTATPQPASQTEAPLNADSDSEAASAQPEASTAGDTGSSEAGDKADQPEDTALVNSLLPDVDHIEGDPNAPVTIVEFSDFKCPYCASFATGTLPWLREYYVKTGKVRFAFKHIATLGPESTRAAEASECAAEQKQFWAYHDQIFADQAAKASELNDEHLITLAADIGLDTAAFSECLTAGRFAEEVKLQTEEAQQLGIQATPGFVINSSFTMGAQPYEAFARLINEELDSLGWEAPATLADEIRGLVIYPPAPPPDEILNGVLQNCGIYNEAVSIENVLSSLSHGAVWIAYHADMPAEQVDLLCEVVNQAMAQRDEPMIILSPGPYTDRKIVASAWQVQLTLEDAADPRLGQFLEKFQVGPFTPEPGELCSGGVGQPVS